MTDLPASRPWQSNLTSCTALGRTDHEKKRGRTSATVQWSNRDGEETNSGVFRRLITASERSSEEYDQSGGARQADETERG